uniref:Uncharacterized protein n=1 Tax=Strombidium inclinatum TaxID=197538 RepID=A0A7S3IWT3_9SPIT|mmetsp:Transcript_42664/g.65438  ORF Transcript_42664/g.65438 Transcript_42664/m.65438 type:complete len:219 (+) Transcript_42664:1059-1715(+)
MFYATIAELYADLETIAAAEISDSEIENYNRTWYDVTDDYGSERSFYFTPSKVDGDIFITVQFNIMGNLLCYAETSPVPTVTLTQGDTTVSTTSSVMAPIRIAAADQTADTKITFSVLIDWNEVTDTDYSIVVVSKHTDLAVKDYSDETNKYYMDGTTPSGFTTWTMPTSEDDSSETSSVDYEKVPTSFANALEIADDTQEFMQLLSDNPLILIIWWG